MKYIATEDLSRLLTIVLAGIEKSGKIDQLRYYLNNGELNNSQDLIATELVTNKDMISNLTDHANDIEKLRKSYSALYELNRKREAEIDQQKILLDGLENLLWTNLEDFNRLKAQYSIDELRKIFTENLGTPKLCEECGKMFVATSPKQKFCTVECRKKSTSRRRYSQASV